MIQARFVLYCLLLAIVCSCLQGSTLPAAASNLFVETGVGNLNDSNGPVPASLSYFTGHGDSSGVCGTGSFPVDCSFSGSAFTTGSGIAEASSTDVDCNCLGSADANLVYSYEIVGPGSDPVPVTFFYTLSGVGNALSATIPPGSQWQMAAQIDIGAGGGPYQDQWSVNTGIGQCEELINYQTVNSCGTGFNERAQVTLMVDPNTIYTISLSADILSEDNSTASVSADPFIEIDPSFAGASEFSVLVSPGIDNSPLTATPEPNSVAVMIFAFIGMAVFASKRLTEKSTS
jgi:hypothetical protein